MRELTGAPIELRGVSFSYESGTVLHDVSLRVEPHDYLLLLGANGSGKSTLLKVAPGLLEPSGGEARLFGMPAADARARTRRLRPAARGRLGPRPGNRDGGRGRGTGRALRKLAEEGTVDVIREDPVQARYRLCSTEHHHHLLCESCGKVTEIPQCDIEPWAKKVARKQGFIVRTHRAEILGLCGACAGLR
jgi:Fur family ferric uptake transcriptional regulator